MKTYGLRDIIGPIMIGPSSSHTAGALAIAKMTRMLCDSAPVQAEFTLYGSFAYTGNGHGTDKALVGGILGFEADDLAIRDSFDHAADAGVEISFKRNTSEETSHPNTVDVALTDDTGKRLVVRGESIGGGAAVIKRIDGVDVDITGEHTSIVVKQKDKPGVLAHIATCLSQENLNIATTRLYRTRRGETAYTVMETDDHIPATVQERILENDDVEGVRVIPANSKQQADSSAEINAERAFERFASYDFSTGAELLERCNETSTSIADLFSLREEAFCEANGSHALIDEYLDCVLKTMEESATAPIANPAASMGGLIGGEAEAFSTGSSATPVVDPLTALAGTYAMAVLETNASMGRIVAAPTAGSAGVLPAVLLALKEQRGFSDSKLKKGLLTAAAIGTLIARNASVSGAEGGCQAEIGSAAAMAAAATVELFGGTPQEAVNAASNALMCLMGLVCDPIGGLVEVPCQKRNATAAATALVCAQMSMSGIGNLVDFDETVAAMDAVGKSLPFELRESALGGIAATPSACAFCKSCLQ